MGIFAMAALCKAQNGGICVKNTHIFTDATARDTYFSSHASEKTANTYISVGAGFQQWSGSAWVDKTAVLQGPPGAKGDAGSSATLTCGGVTIQNIEKTSNINLLSVSDQVAPNIIDGKYIGNAGTQYTSTNYFVSSKIPVTPGQIYAVSAISNAVNKGMFYTSADVFIGLVNAETFTVPDNAAYIRLNIFKSSPWATAGMLIKGSALPALYTPFGAEVDWLKLNAVQLQMAGNRWFGKKMNCLGDSITAGTQTAGTAWPVLVGQYLGLNTVRNYGISGTTLGEGTGSVNPMTLRVAAMDDNADIITFSGGTNDIAFINNLGVYGDTVATSFFGALDVLIKSLIVKYPAKLIIGITPPQRASAGAGSGLENYANAIKQMCAKYSVPCLDQFHSFGLCPVIPEQSAALFGDGLHPNAAGKIVQANKIAGFIRTQ